MTIFYLGIKIRSGTIQPRQIENLYLKIQLIYHATWFNDEFMA